MWKITVPSFDGGSFFVMTQFAPVGGWGASLTKLSGSEVYWLHGHVYIFL